MFDAIFFDLDGTLIDTERLAMDSNRAAFDALGLEPREDLLHAMIGKDAASVALMLTEALPGVDLARLEHEVNQRFSAGIDQGLTLKPGARALLEILPGPKALVTSSERQNAQHKLQVTGLAAYFTLVITAQDVAQRKPFPEPYLLAAQRLGVDPRRCLVFEDSDIGAAAAFAAGCCVVQIKDVLEPSGAFAHHLAPDLLSGARMAGLSLEPLGQVFTK